MVKPDEKFSDEMNRLDDRMSQLNEEEKKVLAGMNVGVETDLLEVPANASTRLRDAVDQYNERNAVLVRKKIEEMQRLSQNEKFLNIQVQEKKDIGKIKKEIKRLKDEVRKVVLLEYSSYGSSRLNEAVDQYNEPLLGHKINMERRIIELESELKDL